MVRRLLVTYLTITALTLAVVVVPLGRVFADREQARLTFDVERDAQAVASLVEDALEAGRPPSIDATLAQYRGTGGRIVVVDAAGVSVVDSSHPGGPRRDFSTRPEIAAALDGARSRGIRRSETVGSDLLYVAVPVASSGRVHGAVRITYPTSAVDARVRSTWLRLGLLSLVVLGLVATVGLVFASWVTGPVRRLQAAAAVLAEGDLGVRVDADDGPSELRGLAHAFNRMAEQLAQLVSAQHRFVADASHQLRTPLTALRLRLETLAPDVAEEARPKLDAAIDETHRLGRLVHSLLVLARGDATEAGAVPVDLAAVVAERIEVWRPVAVDQGIRLREERPDDAWVLAAPGAIEQILDNLVSNALDAVPEGTTVTVRVRRGADGAVGTPVVELHVVDEGPGLDDEARAHAFERFWRPPGATRVGADGGFGLGLAIVDQLARRSGGRARLEPGPGGVGLDATVTFVPCARPAEPTDGRNLHLSLTSD